MDEKVRNLLIDDIAPKMILNDCFKINLCSSCYGEEVDSNFQAVGICCKCKQITNVFSPYIIDRFKEQNIPSIFLDAVPIEYKTYPFKKQINTMYILKVINGDYDKYIPKVN